MAVSAASRAIRAALVAGQAWASASRVISQARVEGLASKVCLEAAETSLGSLSVGRLDTGAADQVGAEGAVVGLLARQRWAPRSPLLRVPVRRPSAVVLGLATGDQVARRNASSGRR
jgi:hypothetical protein